MQMWCKQDENGNVCLYLAQVLEQRDSRQTNNVVSSAFSTPWPEGQSK